MGARPDQDRAEASVAVFRLPVTGVAVAVRQPDGADDVALLEAEPGGADLALVARVAAAADGSPLDCSALPVPDLEALVLVLRQIVLGDRVRAEVACPACGARADVSFGIAEYLTHHRPRPGRGVAAADAPGWLTLPGSAIRFRLPTVADQGAAAATARPTRELVRRCLGDDVSGRVRRRVEAAMETLAPPLSRSLAAACPECGMCFAVYFDVRSFVVRELVDQAAFVYEDVHVLAARYHWSEASILAMPRRRRLRYAELASGAS